jgi:hypothetical protein
LPPSSATTAGTMVMRCPRSAGALDSLVGWRVRHSQWREAPADRGCRPADGGNPAAGPLVTYLSSVVLVSGCCLPGQAGSPCTPPPSTRRPRPPVPRRLPVAPALTGSPRPGPPPDQRGRDARHPSHARQGAIIPMPFRSRRPARPEPGQPWSQALIVIARGDQRVERNGDSDEVPGSCGVPTSGVPGPWHCPRADSPIRWTTRCSPHQGPRRHQGQAGDRGRRTARALESGA